MSLVGNVLVVAPRTDLNLSMEEAVAAVNILGGYLLQGNVTVSALLSEVQRSNWDVLWFSTHGDEHGIVLSDGHLDTSSLTTIVRTSNARLVVLNTCSSLDVALAMHNELLVDFICTVRPVPDIDAYLTGKQFAIHLSRGKSTLDAYLAAKPGQNRDYLFLPGRMTATVNPQRPSRRDDNASLEDVLEELKRIAVLVDGSDRWGTDGLRKNVSRIDAMVQAMSENYERRMANIEAAIEGMKKVTTMLSVIALLLLLTIIGMAFAR